MITRVQLTINPAGATVTVAGGWIVVDLEPRGRVMGVAVDGVMYDMTLDGDRPVITPRRVYGKPGKEGGD